MKASVVINAAGRGSRLGKNIPKSLVKVGERFMLDWQLTEMCRHVENVFIVVGYMAEDVSTLARSLRPDIRVVVNERWASTKTGGSLSLGAALVQQRCLSLDGDLLVAPDDLELILGSTTDLIGISSPASKQPVFAQLDGNGYCHGFSYDDPSPWEWTGLVNFDPKHITLSDGNVFEMVESILPIQTCCVRCVEVDMVEDLELAERTWPQIFSQGR